MVKIGSKTYFKTSDLAEWIGRSPLTVYRWLEFGLPSVKFGLWRAYPVKETKKWLQDRYGQLPPIPDHIKQTSLF